MGFLKKMAQIARESNERESDARIEYWNKYDSQKKARQQQKVVEERRVSSIKCCANCHWYGRILKNCEIHNYRFDKNNEEYQYMCDDFCRK